MSEHLEPAGYEVEVVAVEDEFQRAEEHAGNRMLRMTLTLDPVVWHVE